MPLKRTRDANTPQPRKRRRGGRGTHSARQRWETARRSHDSSICFQAISTLGFSCLVMCLFQCSGTGTLIRGSAGPGFGRFGQLRTAPGPLAALLRRAAAAFGLTGRCTLSRGNSDFLQGDEAAESGGNAGNTVFRAFWRRAQEGAFRAETVRAIALLAGGSRVSRSASCHPSSACRSS